MKELKADWNAIEDKIALLFKDCDYFDLNRPMI